MDDQQEISLLWLFVLVLLAIKVCACQTGLQTIWTDTGKPEFFRDTGEENETSKG